MLMKLKIGLSCEQNIDEKMNCQLSTIERNVAKAITESKIIKSFLEKANGPNSKAHLTNHLFPENVLEKTDNVTYFTIHHCKKCFFKLKQEDKHFKEATKSETESKIAHSSFG